MYIQNGIAYAGEQRPPLKISGIRALEGYKLWVRFNTGEARICDFTELLKSPAFLPLKNLDVFKDVYIDYGVPAWKNGEIDIAPEFLYDHGVIAENAQNA